MTEVRDSKVKVFILQGKEKSPSYLEVFEF